jgi:hypothetical protein
VQTIRLTCAKELTSSLNGHLTMMATTLGSSVKARELRAFMSLSKLPGTGGNLSKALNGADCFKVQGGESDEP